MEFNAENGIVGVRLSEFVMTRLASRASTSGRGLLTFIQPQGFELSFSVRALLRLSLFSWHCSSHYRFGDNPPLLAALDCRGIGHDACPRRSSAKEFASLKRGGCREGVLSCLPRGDRTGCDLVDCSRPRAGTSGPGICHAPLHAGRRLGRLIERPTTRSQVAQQG
jgi:hypothetical protein